jgi:hypothetical protein
VSTHQLNTQCVSAVQKAWSSCVSATILLQHRPAALALHYASCRTLEQQGREDDEGKGQRLAADVKSDLY